MNTDESRTNRELVCGNRKGLWDLFNIMGGLESMMRWEEEGLAKKDKIHFTNKGYTLIGDLFFNALMRFYSERI